MDIVVTTGQRDEYRVIDGSLVGHNNYVASPGVQRQIACTLAGMGGGIPLSNVTVDGEPVESIGYSHPAIRELASRLLERTNGQLRLKKTKVTASV